jgi:hypothetical protein
VAAAAAAADPVQSADAAVASLQQWLQEKGTSFSTSALQTQGSVSQVRTGLAATDSISSGQVLSVGASCMPDAAIRGN